MTHPLTIMSLAARYASGWNGGGATTPDGTPDEVAARLTRIVVLPRLRRIS